MTVWITSDLHLGHAKIIGFEPKRQCFASIQEHDDAIELNWRANISKRDVVYVLGDVAWKGEGWERFRSFPGIKKLVRGNHDNLSTATYLEVFNQVLGTAELGPKESPLLLSHYPIHPSCVGPAGEGRYALNVHGHIHGRKIQQCRSGAPRYSKIWEDDPRYLNACVEHWDFGPFSLECALNHVPASTR